MFLAPSINLLVYDVDGVDVLLLDKAVEIAAFHPDKG